MLGPDGIANVNPAGTFLVVASLSNLNVYVTHGHSAPSQVSTTANSGAGDETLLFHPSGQFLYTGGLLGGIGAASLDSFGKVSTVTGSPFTPGGVLLGIGPSGTFLYVLSAANPANDPLANQSINVFSINSTTGALSAAGSTSVPPMGHNTGDPAQPWLANSFSHSGRLLFLGDHRAGTVYTYGLDQNTGAASLAGTAVAGANAPTAMALSPNDSRLYVAEQQDIVGFSVSSTGTLMPLNSGGALATIPQPSGLFTPSWIVQIDLTGKFLYAVTPDEIFVYVIDQSRGGLSTNSAATMQRRDAPFGRPWGQISFGNSKP